MNNLDFHSSNFPLARHDCIHFALLMRPLRWDFSVTFGRDPAETRCRPFGVKVDVTINAAYLTGQARPGREVQFLNAPLDLHILTARIRRQQSILKRKNICI